MSKAKEVLKSINESSIKDNIYDVVSSELSTDITDVIPIVTDTLDGLIEGLDAMAELLDEEPADEEYVRKVIKELEGYKKKSMKWKK